MIFDQKNNATQLLGAGRWTRGAGWPTCGCSCLRSRPPATTMLAVPRAMGGAPLHLSPKPAAVRLVFQRGATLHTTAAAAAETARSARNRAKAPKQRPVRMLRPATDGVPEYRRVPGIAAENAHAGARRITDVTEWSKSPLVSLGLTNDPNQLSREAKIFRRVPVRPGFTKLLTDLIHGRNNLRLDIYPEEHPPVQPTSIQRLAFQHFLVDRDEQTLVPRSTKAKLFAGASGWLFPKSPGTSTLLAGETGGGKTFAYLLPLLERLKSTQKDEDLQKEFGLRDAHTRADARAAHFAAEATKELDAFDEPDPEPEWVEDPEDMLMSDRQPHKEPQHWLSGEELEEFEAFLKSAERSQGTEVSRKEAYERYQKWEIQQADVAAWTPPSKPEVPFLVRPRSVILAPSHELARQIEASVKSLTHIEKLRTLCTSRNDWRKAFLHDIKMMSQGRWEEVRPIDVLVTTPERLLDLVTPLSVRNARYQALHDKYLEGQDFAAAKMLEKHVERDVRRQLVSLDAVRALVCDEADVLWDEDHMIATRNVLKQVSQDRFKGWKERAEPRPLVPADLIHVTASVGAGFKKQLTDRWPDTKYVLSKGLHQLPSSLRVKFANVGPTRHIAFAREVRDALLSDPTDRSRVVVFCDRRHTVKNLSMILNRVGILYARPPSRPAYRLTLLKQHYIDERV